MEHDSLDIYGLRRAWERLEVRTDRLEAENRRLAASLAAGKASSSQAELARSYNFSMWCAVVIVVLAPVLKFLAIPGWVSAIYAVYGAVMFVVILRFKRFITSCDYGSMPIVTAIAHCMKIIRWRWRLLAISSVLGVAVIIPLLRFLYYNDMSTFWAGCIGGITGLAIGIVKFRRQSRLARRMLRSLRSALKPD